MTLMFTRDCDGIYRKALGAGAKKRAGAHGSVLWRSMAGSRIRSDSSGTFATHIKDVSPEEMNAAMAAQKP